MRLGLTFLLNLLIVMSLSAQINDESPFPVDFVITAPASVAGTYDY